ncbi:unnamed protein product [Staurois parvus]|uniref:Uncharacterized protein n=1 Tax=Staurois parvus TaxID=386267 RepID=A0ABN9EWU9_9NEOB|nr:unnamed protein product [Staurois parvus]
MYINSRTGALAERVDISKHPPTSIACARALGACGTMIRTQIAVRAFV